MSSRTAAEPAGGDAARVTAAPRGRHRCVKRTRQTLTLPDGRIFARGRFGNALLCDACGTRRAPITLAAGTPQEKRWRARQ